MPGLNPSRARESRTFVAWAMLAALNFLAASANAQGELSLMPQQRLVLLQRGGEGIQGSLITEVDGTIAGAVRAQIPGASLYVSPVPFEDVELAAGCNSQEQDADCLQRIAGSLGADWLLVRELNRDRNGRVYLTLVAQDGPQAIVTRRAVAQLSGAKRNPSQVVPMLVERLYPQQNAGDRPLTAPRGLSPASVVGWSSTAVGGSLLAAGVAMGVLSQRDHRAYQRADIDSAADVDRARDLLDRSQQRARIANGLLIGGAGAGAAGALALLWKYVRPKPDEQQKVRLGVAYHRGGVKVSLNGAWRGGL
jgi:hypothetical protein